MSAHSYFGCGRSPYESFAVAYCICGHAERADTNTAARLALRAHIVEQSGASESAPTNVPEAANRKRGNAPGAPTARTS